MSAKIGRNEPCPCGSGKKYKKCCEKTGSDVASGGGGVLFLVSMLVVGAVAATLLWVRMDSPADQSTADVVSQPISTPTTGTVNPGGANWPTPPPPGPPPPGKIWSPEHGHWHDAAGGAAGATSAADATGITAPVQQLRPQPPGPAPPGKVWSPEHGHWHDAP